MLDNNKKDERLNIIASHLHCPEEIEWLRVYAKTKAGDRLLKDKQRRLEHNEEYSTDNL